MSVFGVNGTFKVVNEEHLASEILYDAYTLLKVFKTVNSMMGL